MGNFWGRGKMLWVYELDQCGDPGWLVLLARSLGCAGLIVKAWDGSTYLPQCEQVIKLAHACGMLVIAWGYNYGQDIPGEVAAMIQAVQSGQADGLIMDVEEEFEVAMGQTMAEDLLSALASSAVGYAGFGFTSFGLPADHSSFPFETFAKAPGCLAAFPQVYFGDFGMTPEDALSQSLASYAEYGVTVAPICQAYSDPSINYVASADDVVAFMTAAKAAGIPGVSFFSAQDMTLALFGAVKSTSF